jgi:hypothetical protein
MSKSKKGGTLLDTSLMTFIRATPKLLPSTTGIYPSSNVYRGYNSLATAVNNGQKTVGYYNSYPAKTTGGVNINTKKPQQKKKPDNTNEKKVTLSKKVVKKAK